MIDGFGAAARALGLLATAYLIGTTGFLLRSGLPAHPGLRAWAGRCAAGLPLAALILLLSLAAALLIQAAVILGAQSVATLFDRELLLGLIAETHFGRIWLLRMLLGIALLVLLGAAMLIPRAMLARPLLALTGLLSAVIASAAALTGHASGSERAAVLVPLHMVHILALGLWLGALPAWISLLRVTQQEPVEAVQHYAANAMRRFSRLALLCMACIVGVGYVLAEASIDNQGDLLGTRYGLLLTIKVVLLAVVLLFANLVRSRFLPILALTPQPADRADAARHVMAELLFGVTILVLGAWLAQTTPALHDQPQWWLPFRISLEATWPQWPSVPLVLAGGLLMTAGALSLRVLRMPGARIAAALGLAIAGLGMIAWGLSVPAFPDTYRRSQVAYQTESIEHGKSLFQTHCVSCHGTGGLGDGPLAGKLPVPPANLSQPHTALHTAGDMYWWVSHGIPKSLMPGFASLLSEEERWDLVNFLRAFSQGFEARTLKPEILPMHPWLGAPVFYFDDTSGNRADLKDFRGRNEVLLVFFSAADAQSRQRLAQLSAAARRLEAAGLRVIAIATDPPGDSPNAPGSSQYPELHGATAQHVWGAYQLLSRTLGDRGDTDRIAMHWHHAEFLIDRFGYVRARWIPAERLKGWDDLGALLQEVAQLRREPEIRPPPDLHIH